MASPGSNEPPTSADGKASPTSQATLSEKQRPVSVISSHMTDLASEDGERNVPVAPKTHRAKGSESANRPETAKTAASSSKGGWGAARKNLAASKRGSITSQTASTLGRTSSLTSRSHVPSLTSNAFFHPMSSQKLQAQRASAARPLTTSQPPPPPPLTGDLNDNATDVDGSVVNDLASLSNHIAPVQHMVFGEDYRRAPSRGTEVTEQENFDRRTWTTSPTGHQPTVSMSESVQPLQKPVKEDRLRPKLDLSGDKTFKDLKNLPSPIKSPFSSSFLSGMGDQSGQNREMEGGEKLVSTPSTPRLTVQSQHRPKTESTAATQQASNTRNYEYFEGNTAFFFGGRWQNTRQRPINIATGLFVIIPCVLFFVFEASWFWHNISPAVPVVFAYIAYICFSSFIHASISDPGILPRNLHQFPPIALHDDPLRVDPPTNDWTLIKSAEPSAAAMEFPVKHCRTCNIWRPPRAHHCRLCDNCIETHDHHCVWLNNCVGKRNYRYFFTFVSSATLLALYLIATSLTQLIIHMNRMGISFGQSIEDFRGCFALIIIGIIAFLYPAALMGYHIFLMARGETTREFMNSHKFTKSERYRPFDQRSIWRNIIAVLCRPRSPTYYRFKNKYENGDQRLGIHRDLLQRLDSRGLEMGTVQPAGQGFQGPVSIRATSQGAQ